jgi:hypothetical protein
MKAIEDENRRLKRMYADLSMQADLLAHSDVSGRSFRQHPVSHSGVSGHLRIVAA